MNDDRSNNQKAPTLDELFTSLHLDDAPAELPICIKYKNGCQKRFCDGHGIIRPNGTRTHGPRFAKDEPCREYYSS